MAEEAKILESIPESFRIMNADPINMIICRGTGNFSYVYEGIYGGTVVAIKQLNGTIQPKRFLKEVDALTKVQHPNVVKLIGFYFSKPLKLIVTSYASEGPFTIVERDDIDVETRFKLLVDIAAGLNYVHSINMVHRDVKPANCTINT